MRRWVVIAVVVALVTAAGLFARDVGRAERALTTARELVATARADVVDGDVAAAREALHGATAEVATARGSVDGPIWSLAANLPGVGDSPRTVRRVVELAGTAVDVAATGVEVAAPLLRPEATLVDSLGAGRADLGALSGLADELAALPVDELTAARDRLAATGSTLVPERLRTARADALQLAEELQSLLETAGHATAVLPAILGADGPRAYLLALQNPAELRGTGGLIGLIGVVRFEDGAFSIVPPSELQQADEFLEDADRPAADVSPAYEQRYGRRGGASVLQNVNLDPDLPTVGAVLLDLWERRVGDELDGVIALDPVLLAEILRATGPVRLPASFTEDPRIPRRVTAANLLQVVSVEAYEVFGGLSPERKAFLEAVSTRTLGRLGDGGTDGAALARALVRTAPTRHLQLYSRTPAEQAHLRALGVAGALEPQDPTQDLLAVTANNAAGNKQDVHVGHAIDWELGLEDLTVAADGTVDATRHSTVTVLVDNPLPTTGMHRYIIGSGLPGEGLRGPPGLNRTWFTLWLPSAGEVLAGRSPDGTVAAETSRIRDQRAVDVFLETPSEARRSFTLETRSPARLTPHDGRLRYAATLWRQAKAIPDDVDLVFRPPAGWQVADAELVGGGDGWRPDLSVDPRPDHPDRLRLFVEADRVGVRGQLTADAELVVDLVPRQDG